MASHRQGEITQLLRDLGKGHKQAMDDLLPLIYDELHRMAHQERQRLRPSQTLNTTALVHEAYLKLVGKDEADWQDRAHFFRVAARAMRDIAVDYARRQRAAKRGGGQHGVSLDERLFVPANPNDDVLALDEALAQLEQIDKRQCEIVELRYFVGFTIPETAEVLGISAATVKRDWMTARAWLYRKISE